MKPLHLKFESEDQANAVLVNVTDSLDKWRNISVIGHIFVGGEQIAGWHVNVLLMDDEDITPLEPFLIDVKSPMRVWAGVNDGN